MNAARGTTTLCARTARYLAFGCLIALAVVTGSLPADVAAATPLSGIDLSNYVRVGRFDLPEPKAHAGSAEQPPGTGGLGGDLRLGHRHAVRRR